MKVITVSSNSASCGVSEYLALSCDLFKIDLIVLEYPDHFFSNRLKDALLEEYLKDVDDNEIIFFTDAVDTVFLANEEEILNKFESFNSPLLFSSEINCWPDKSLSGFYPKTDYHFKYLNTGGFIGRAGILKSLYKKYPIFNTVFNSFSWSNQYYWNYIFSLENNSIKIDNNCTIFYNTAIELDDYENFKTLLSSDKKEEIIANETKRLARELMFKNGRIKSAITNSWPCHIHFPGPISKLLMDQTLSKLKNKF